MHRRDLTARRIGWDQAATVTDVTLDTFRDTDYSATYLVGHRRRACVTGGGAGFRPVALASKGAGGRPCKLDEAQLAQLAVALEAGPAAAAGGSRTSGGPWPGSPRWPCLFGVSYMLRGVSFL